MANDHPKRRKTDTWNGRFRSMAVGVGWTLTLVGWAYSAGVHTARDDEQGRLIQTNHYAIQQIEEVQIPAIHSIDREMVRDVAALTAAVDALTESVRQLQSDLRAHDRASRE